MFHLAWEIRQLQRNDRLSYQLISSIIRNIITKDPSTGHFRKRFQITLALYIAIKSW